LNILENKWNILPIYEYVERSRTNETLHRMLSIRCYFFSCNAPGHLDVKK